MQTKKDKLNDYYRDLEKRIYVTVMSASPNDEICAGCGRGPLVFHAHLLETNKVVDRCKLCLLDLAGSEERIFVKTTSRGLQTIWNNEARLERTKSEDGQSVSEPTPTPLTVTDYIVRGLL